MAKMASLPYVRQFPVYIRQRVTETENCLVVRGGGDVHEDTEGGRKRNEEEEKMNPHCNWSKKEWTLLRLCVILHSFMREYRGTRVAVDMAVHGN